MKRSEKLNPRSVADAECYDRMVQSVSEYAILLLDTHGQIVAWNAGAEHIFGWLAGEIIGRPYACLWTPEDRAQGLPQLEMDGAAARGSTPDERWHVRKDGSQFFASGTVIAVWPADGVLGPRPARYAKLLHDATAHQQAQTRLQVELDHERRIAEILQRSLLPTLAETDFEGLHIATAYEAALPEAQVGGDFYDAFLLNNGRVALVVGDVSGKGLMAATRTAEIRYALRAFLRENGDPARALFRLNNFVCDAHRLDELGGGFIVLSLAVLDPASGEATLVVAGAEPPLVVRADSGADVIDNGGLILGLDPQEEYLAARLHLAPDDTLVMVTDGITEARRGNDFFGHDGLVQLATGAQTLGPLSAMSRAILDEVRSFANGTLRDDACLLLARLRRPNE